MQKQFDVLKVGLLKRLDGYLINPQVEIDRTMGEFLLFVSGKLYSQADIAREEVKYPADWWQAFKLRFFPARLLKIFPVEYTTRVLSISVHYPELHKRLHMPDEPHFFTNTTYTY